MRLKCLFIVAFAFHAATAQEIPNGFIKGKISLSSIWAPRVYLLKSSDIFGLLSGSDKNLFDSATINADGSFFMPLKKLPSGNFFYRLNIVYKGSGGGEIIRDGLNENFIFLVLNRNSVIEINANADSLEYYSIKSGKVNQLLKKIRIIRFPLTTVMLQEKKWFEDNAMPGRNMDSLMTAVLQRVQQETQHNNLLLKKFIDTVQVTEAALVAALELFTNSAPGSELDYLERKLTAMQGSAPGHEYIGQFLERIQEIKYSLPLRSVAPAIALQDLKREHIISLYDVKAKLILVDFWASWCKPCREENRTTVRSLYAEFKRMGFEVFSVSMDTDLEKWRQAVNVDGVEWTQVSDLLGGDSPIYGIYKIKGLPTGYILDENKKILGKDLRGPDLYNFVKDYFSKSGN